MGPDEIIGTMPGSERSNRKPPPKWLRYVSLGIAVAVPVVFMTLGVQGLIHVRHVQSLLRPIPGGEMTTGTVLGSHESCYRSCTYEPEIQYSDESGHVYTFTAPYQSDYPPVGSAVRVSYNPKVPGQAHDISNGPSSWSIELFTAIFMISISGIYLLGGGALALRLWRKRVSAHPGQDVLAAVGRVGSGTQVDLGGPPPPSMDKIPSSARGLVGQAWGFFLAGVALAAFAVAVGVSHHASWVLILAAIGLLAGGMSLTATMKRCRMNTDAPDRPVNLWWARRGLWLMLGSNLPIYVAIAGAAVALNHHH